jgi:HSP20 family protein
MFEYRGFLDRPARDTLGLDDVLRGFDQLFREFDRDVPLTSFGTVPAQLSEEDDRFVLKAEVPGISDKDVHVDLHDGALTITAERPVEVPAGYTARRRERSALKFSRTYILGDRVDPEKTTAEIKDGVLTVSLGKAANQKKKSIAVKVS